ncbi:hypothetical protein [Brevundimonas lutea]|uniref:hypothetical protein n=1 Tax=Brevundimonas lutea TaxID=2293980 RepID=UPI0013CEBED6|nr:hypothetical protein [Brevundimonas lutea]
MRLILILAALLTATPALAQEPSVPAPQASAPAAPADVQSIDAIVAALYDVISGDAGQARDWDRFRSLFHPTGRLMPTGRDAQGQATVRAVSPDDYIARSEPFMLDQGFHERELARRTERFGAIAHVFSTYDARHSLSDPEPFARGVNSIQLFHDGARWWILSVYWQAENPETPLPAEYLLPSLAR